MPRQPRIDHPGLLHHVMARGIERRAIFLDRRDYDDFLDRVATTHEKVPVQILAWALMPNHFHFLIRSGSAGLVPFMRRLMAGYAVAFNLRHERAGHLFQNRYKSIICEESEYLLELVRYIHLNPCRAGLVKSVEDLRRFSYSGHRALMGDAPCPWQNTEDVLGQFAQKREAARERYEAFVREGFGQGRRPELTGGGLVRSQGGRQDLGGDPRSSPREAFDARILGSGSFVEKVWASSKAQETLAASLEKKGLHVPEVAEKIAALEGFPASSLFERTRKREISRGKAMLMHVGVDILGRQNREMARLTRMTEAAASRARQRGADLFRGSKLEQWVKGN